jgi:hypothetical protein
MKILKNILFILFPFIPIFKNIKSDWSDIGKDLKDFDFWDSNIGWTLKLYTLTAVIPFAGTVMILIFTILGQSMKFGFFEGIWKLWSGFYATGTFLDIAAWRWQLFLLLFAFIFTISQKD